MIFEVDHIALRHDVCPEKYVDLLPRLVSGTTSKAIEPMKKIEKRGSKKKLK